MKKILLRTDAWIIGAAGVLLFTGTSIGQHGANAEAVNRANEQAVIKGTFQNGSAGGKGIFIDPSKMPWVQVET